MAKLVVELDNKKVWEAIQEAEGLPSALQSCVSQVTGKANSMSAGFRTEVTKVYATGERVGGTRPSYAGDVQTKGRSKVGLIHPKNYAALKDNYLHNTLLKSL